MRKTCQATENTVYLDIWQNEIGGQSAGALRESVQNIMLNNLKLYG